MPLTVAETNLVIEDAIAKAKELGIEINVAVCDAGGRLLALARMDGATWAGVYGSQGTAAAAVVCEDALGICRLWDKP